MAINLDDARIPDNAGAQPIDRRIAARGPAAYFTTLPIKSMVAALRGAGHPAAVSYSAGGFVCNHVFYGLQHALKRRRGTRSGFMHLCALPGQAGDAPRLPVTALIDGVRIALAAALATHEDVHTPEGRIA